MELQDAKNILEEVGIHDKIDDNLIEASSLILDRLGTIESEFDGLKTSERESRHKLNSVRAMLRSNIPTVSPYQGRNDDYVEGCNCPSCQQHRIMEQATQVNTGGTTIPQPTSQPLTAEEIMRRMTLRVDRQAEEASNDW